ncbi:MAG TPA: hydroxymethylbilane synthase [Steroidobacteraceae bacterium]|nr:hydroxymethylbilane synthase [Steroidobacteraceae bacterium]
MQQLRIATRRSALALWQADHVAALLRASRPGLAVTLVPIVTQGDRIQDRPLADAGGKGLFIKELEVAMAEDRADIAVHSMKDVPAELPDGFIIAAVLPRADPRDAFLSRRYARFAELPRGARVGTSSQRRQCLLRAARPDLAIAPLRGNVDTRLRKLDDGDFDAIILAAAGLVRLGLGARITEYLDHSVSLPAVGQGIVGLECRNAPDLLALLEPLDHRPTRECLTAERAFAARLEGSCQSPIAGFATVAGRALRLEGLVGAPDGATVYRQAVEGDARDGVALGRSLAEALLEAGAAGLLATLRGTGT